MHWHFSVRKSRTALWFIKIVKAIGNSIVFGGAKAWWRRQWSCVQARLRDRLFSRGAHCLAACRQASMTATTNFAAGWDVAALLCVQHGGHLSLPSAGTNEHDAKEYNASCLCWKSSRCVWFETWHKRLLSMSTTSSRYARLAGSAYSFISRLSFSAGHILADVM